MKKLYSLLLVAALLLPVLAGCQSATEKETAPGTTPPETTPPVTQPKETQPKETQPAVQYITPEEAQAIALKDADLAEADVRDLEVELDLDDGPAHYDVDFEKGSDDYDYDIDAVTGEILRVEKPAKQTSGSTSATTEKQLTRDEARDIALKHAGLKLSEVRDLEVELDREGGTVHYDVDFEKGTTDYEYEIDAKTGNILKSHKEIDG